MRMTAIRTVLTLITARGVFQFTLAASLGYCRPAVQVGGWNRSIPFQQPQHPLSQAGLLSPSNTGHALLHRRCWTVTPSPFRDAGFRRKPPISVRKGADVWSFSAPEGDDRVLSLFVHDRRDGFATALEADCRGWNRSTPSCSLDATPKKKRAVALFDSWGWNHSTLPFPVTPAS
jgi:hypothetical protein